MSFRHLTNDRDKRMPTEPSFKMQLRKPSPPSKEDSTHSGEYIHESIARPFRFNQFSASLNGILSIVGLAGLAWTLMRFGWHGMISPQFGASLLLLILAAFSCWLAIARLRYYRRANSVVSQTTPLKSAVCLKYSKWTNRCTVSILDLSPNGKSNRLVRLTKRRLSQSPAWTVEPETDELLPAQIFFDPLTHAPVAVRIYGTIHFLLAN